MHGHQVSGFNVKNHDKSYGYDIEDISNIFVPLFWVLGTQGILMHNNLRWIIGKRGKGSTMHYAMIVTSIAQGLHAMFNIEGFNTYLMPF